MSILQIRVQYLTRLLVVALLLKLKSCAFQCTKEGLCSCYNISDQIVVDCSYLGLETSPTFLHSVEIIDLSHNLLLKFPKRNQIPNDIVILNISYNNISDFEENPCKGLYKLRNLRIDNNAFILNETIFKTSFFKDLRSLKFLNMKNTLGDDLAQYPSEMISHLVNLRHLSIDGLKHSVFGEEFEGMKFLSDLNLSGLSGSCDIPLITNRTFQYLRYLVRLDLSGCKITNIYSESFKIPELMFLDLSYNEDLQFDILRNISNDLQFTKIDTLILKQIHGQFQLGTEIKISYVQPLQSTSLRILNADSNRIQSMESGVLKVMPKTLQSVSLADNILTYGLYAFESMYLENLIWIDLSFQFRSHHPFPPKINPLEYFDLFNHARRRYVGKNFKSVITLPLPLKLNTLLFRESYLKYSIPEMHLLTNVLEYIYLQNNTLYEWIGPINGTESVKTLDLTGNQCYKVSTFFFDNFVSLQSLLIGNNLLGDSLSVDENADIFKNLQRLQILDIHNNEIKVLPTTLFKKLSNLKSLDVSQNSIQNFDLNLTACRNMTQLNLSFNKLSHLSSDTTRMLNEISDASSLEVDLSGNPLLCNCDTIPFIQWVLESKAKGNIHFMKYEDYYCFDRSLSKMLFLEVDISQLEEDCAPWSISTAAIIAIAVSLSLVLLIGVFIYVYWYKLVYKYYSGKLLRDLRKRNGYEYIEGNNFEYDVFLAFCEEDKDFANKVKEKLKDKYEVCFHLDDFRPGEYVYVNIVKSIEASKKIVFILSPSFLKSKYCDFEVHMAIENNIERGNFANDNMYPIIYKDMLKKCKSKEINCMLKRVTYIEYNEKEEDEFWKRLMLAIDKPHK